jgi:amino acid permease
MADFEKKPSARVGNNNSTPFVDGSSMSGSHNNDVEKGTTEQLQRRLQSRHLQMIAIGGTIGTGLVCLASANHACVAQLCRRTFMLT